jgi:hypothetical protein
VPVISGNRVLFMAVIALVLLLSIVTNPLVEENVQLLHELGLASTPSSSTMRGVEIALDDLLLREYVVTSAVNNSNHDKSPSCEPPVAAEFRDMQAFVAWRVKFLQHIQQPFVTVYRSTIVLLSAQQRLVVVQLFGLLVQQNMPFLGMACTIAFLRTLLVHAHDTHMPIRATCRARCASLWHIWQQSHVYGQLQITELVDGLQTALTETITQIIQIAQSIHSHNLFPQSLIQLLGLSGVLNVDVSRAMRTQPSLFLDMITTVYAPDYQSSTSMMLLESRRYWPIHKPPTSFSVETDSRSVDVGYFRIPWRSTQDDSTVSLLRQCAVMLGQRGKLFV